ncbi:MAG: Hpt domain-containing protein [Pseudomonadota bacterium]
MKESRSHEPIINLNLGDEFTKNSNKLLRELLQMFMKERISLQQKINEAFYSKEKQRSDDLLHKLYGSCVYCGLDRLKASLIVLKTAIKNDNFSEELLNIFNEEIENVVKEADKI